MHIILSILAVLLSVLAIFAYQWVTPLPRLGIATLYHLRKIRVVVAFIAIGLAVDALLLHPTTGQWVVLVIVLLLTPLSGFNHARKFLVSLDDPRHLTTDAADLAADTAVLGYAADDRPCAWPLEILVPHHIVNDMLGDRAIMAVW